MHTAITQAQIDTYQTQGFVVMDEFLTPEELAAWRDAVDQAVRARKDRKLVVAGAAEDERWKDRGAFYDYVFVQRLNLWQDNPAVKALILDPRIGQMATAPAPWASANMTSGWRRAMTCAFMPYGSTFNGIQNILSDEQFASYAIGDELNDDTQNPVVYHRDASLITV